MIILIIFPEYAHKCLNTIIENGFDAYFVGGCVRDSLLGRCCNDIDITTSALPENIISMFEHTIPTGIKHGTVTVIIDGHNIEITTFRQEFGYKDSRHPDNIVFVPNLEDDLSRRDFTINALASSKNGEIIDMFGGLEDLSSGVIKAVGNPENRFDEDALRIVRAFRFASMLGFKIERKTKIAAALLSKKISKISGERIYSELLKLASGISPSAICELVNIDALKDFGIYRQKYDATIIDRLSNIDISPISKLAILLMFFEHDTDLIKKSLKTDNIFISKIKSLETLLKSDIPNNKKQIKLLLSGHEIETIRLYFYYLKLVCNLTDNSLFEMLDEILLNKEVYCISHLKVDGNDLIALGYHGSEIRTALNKALISVINNDIENTKESLLKFLQI